MDTTDKGVKEFIEILNSFSKEEIIQIENNLDKQFLAIKELYKNLNNPELFFKLVIANALLSYYLNMKGEKYWQKFAEFFSKNKSLDYFGEFLKQYNYRLLNQKLKRLEKVKKVLNNLTLKDFDFFAHNTANFVEFLAKKLNQNKHSKTIVFSAKMLVYAYRVVSGEDLMPQKGIMVPLDVRMKKINDNLEFWKKLERQLKFSLLNLDGIVWILFELDEKDIDNSKLNKETKEKLKKLKKVLKKIINSQ